jgi:hypothetical protein
MTPHTVKMKIPTVYPVRIIVGVTVIKDEGWGDGSVI